MKTLELNQMENVEGGWSWLTCAGSAMMAEVMWGAQADAFLPGLGGLGVAAIGCIVGGEKG